MRRLAVTNEKGGSVKTTTSTSLAATLATQMGRRILLIDLDGQGNATSWLNLTPDDDADLVDALITGDPLAGLVRRTAWEGLEVIPATPRLKAAERLLGTEPGAEQLLRRGIDALPAGRWDYVLMDCPPALWMSSCAMTAADEVLVPVEASYMALEGLAALLGTVSKIRQRLNPRLRLLGILLCRVDPRVIARPRSATDLEDLLRQRFDGDLFETKVRESVRLKEAPSHRQPITAYAPHSAAAHDYHDVAVELEARR